MGMLIEMPSALTPEGRDKQGVGDRQLSNGKRTVPTQEHKARLTGENLLQMLSRRFCFWFAAR